MLVELPDAGDPRHGITRGRQAMTSLSPQFGPHGSVASLAAALRRGDVSATALADEALASISAWDGRIGAYITITDAAARAAAAAADAQLRRDPAGAGPLCGIPVAVKDMLCVAGVQATAGSRALEGYVPAHTATAVRRLVEAGAVIVGKTNCDEFGMGSTSENSAYGPVRNPWNTDLVPGGSSGGSATTVAAGTVPYALGTDTGGSIRQPAAFCGVAGFKPTYGRVSRHGLIPCSPSLDQIGPLAHTVEDIALVYAAIAGWDPLDPTTARRAAGDPTARLRDGVRGLRIGVPAEYFGDGFEPGVRSAIEAALRVYAEDLGAHLVDVSLPTTNAALETYFTIAPTEFVSCLAQLDQLRQAGGGGFGPEAVRRIAMGRSILSAGTDRLHRAFEARDAIAAEFASAFADVDVLVSATTPIVAYPLRHPMEDSTSRVGPLADYLADAMTIPVNIAGLPALSLPCGLADGLPVGLQIVGPRFRDLRVLRAAYAYEQATPWHRMRPPPPR